MSRRVCIECGKDLADVTGVIVFIDGQPTGYLLCIDDGSNGQNGFTANQFDILYGDVEQG